MAGAAVAVALDADGRVNRGGIGLFGLSPTALRAAAEAAAHGVRASDIDPEEIGRAAVADLDSVPSDLHGTVKEAANG